MTKSSENTQESTTIVDRISNLPDELLCLILSFLPTKQVVATSVLSIRWAYLWTYVDILEFDNYSIIHPNDEVPGKMQFAQFVNRVLLLCRAPLIKSMSLCCHERGCNEYDIVTWIQTAVSWDVENLYLRFNFELSLNIKRPLSFFYSQTIVSLQLGYANITNMNIPTAPFFPNLRILELDLPDYKTDSLKRLISGCSVLQELLLTSHNLYETCYISSATLQSFVFWNTMSGLENPKLVLDTPALVFLHIVEWQNWEFLVESNMPVLHEARICFVHSKLDDNINSDSLVSFLERLSNVAVLCFSLGTLLSMSANLALHAHIHNLTKLEITASHFCLDLLSNFMEKSKNLQVLTFEKTINIRGIEIQEVWHEPQHVPKCLLSSLQRICIKGYENEEEVELMIKYVLRNAKKLKSMQIHTSYLVKNNFELKFHMIQKISTFPRAFECEISFF